MPRLSDRYGRRILAIPQAVTNALGRKQGPSVHSEPIGDGIADLMEAGIVDNRHKA
jgi:acyl-CoA hydrolase